MTPLPVKMDSIDLMTKCLELTQALTSQGQVFKLNIASGTFKFSLDTRGATTMVVEKVGKKKLSPSQQRRNLRRKEDFLKRKAELSQENSNTVDVNPEEHGKDTEADPRTSKHHKCNLCDRVFRTENGMKIHKGKSHEPEQLRSSSTKVSPLKRSPVKDSPREEQCECCGESMSPQHQCETPQEPEQTTKCELFCVCIACCPFPCEYCNTKFKTQQSYENHKAWYHTTCHSKVPW